MSTAPVLRRAQPETRRSDLRSQQRYPIALEVEYKLLHRGKVARQGSGWTRNISSGGVFFETSDELPSEGVIALVIHWPFLLEGVCPLKLILQGRIVRSSARGVAVETRHHEFRTAGRGSSKALPAQGPGRSVAR